MDLMELNVEQSVKAKLEERLKFLMEVPAEKLTKDDLAFLLEMERRAESRRLAQESKKQMAQGLSRLLEPKE